MEHLDSTALTTSLPQIAQSLGESPLNLSLAMTVYMLTLAVFLPVAGWASDRFGARTVFACAIAVFTTGSVLCGLSSDLTGLVAARALQGAGGAMMVPVGRIVILKTVAKDQLVRAMSLVTMPALIGPALGPLVGGFITTYWSWRWIFFINVPIGILGVVLVLRFVPNLKEDRPDPFDGPGILLSGLALMGLVFGLENIGRGLLPGAVVVGILAVSVLAAGLFLRHAHKVRRPALDLSLFREPTFALAIGSGFLFRIGIGAIPFLLPMMLQVGFGMSAIASGGLTFIGAIGAMSMKMLAPLLLRRFGFRTLLIGNAVIAGTMIAGFGLFRPWTPHAVILAVLLASGFVRSLQFTSLNTLAFAEVPRERSSAASTLSSVMQQLALSLGVASGAAVLALATALAGGAMPGPEQFTPAFLLVGGASAVSGILFLRLPADAGAEVSGHRPRAEDASDA